MDFFYMSDTPFTDPVDGVLGLARPNAKMMLNEALTPTEKRFLLGEVQLTEQKFSTRFQRKYVSWIDFGKPDTKQIAEEPVEITAVDDFFWSVSSQGVRIGEDNVKAFRFAPDEQGVFTDEYSLYTIFDTGASEIYISSLWYNSFIAELTSEVAAYQETRGGFLYATCDAKWPNLYFMV